MEVTLMLAAVLILGIGTAIYLKRRARAKAYAATTARAAQSQDLFAQNAPITGDPRQIGVGYLISHPTLADTFAVRGSLTFTDGPDKWWEHLLETGSGERRWLTVTGPNTDLEVVAWVSRAMPADMTAGADTLEYEGITYKRIESGRAKYTSTGMTGLPASGRVQYHDYKTGANPDLYLSLERYDASGGWELSTGEALNNRLLSIIPLRS